jgi:hypothetical protein
MNPLDSVGQPFSMELANPNPKARRRRDGSRYFVEFEVTKEAWGQFMDCRELAGMVIEAPACHVIALNTPQEDTRASAAPGHPEPRRQDRETGQGGNLLARRLHLDGYFRSPVLWNRLHQMGLYTLQEHKAFVESMPCLFAMLREPWRKTEGSLLKELDVSGWAVLEKGTGMQLGCDGDICHHHVNSAAIAPAGPEMQPEAPRKVPHFYGVPLCWNGHHNGWVHAKYATREEKEKLLEVAVAITAYQVKAVIKTAIGIESLRDLTQSQLDQFENDIGMGP